MTTPNASRHGAEPIIWHRGIDEEIPSMLVTRNLIAVARIFASGKWSVTLTAGRPPSTFETGFSKNLDVAKQAAEDSLIRATGVIAKHLIDWTEKHRRVETKKKKSA